MKEKEKGLTSSDVEKQLVEFQTFIATNSIGTDKTREEVNNILKSLLGILRQGLAEPREVYMLARELPFILSRSHRSQEVQANSGD